MVAQLDDGQIKDKMKYLQQIDKNIWIFDGSTVSWFGMPYTTRMTIVRLNDGSIWIHSPAKIVDRFSVHDKKSASN